MANRNSDDGEDPVHDGQSPTKSIPESPKKQNLVQRTISKLSPRIGFNKKRLGSIDNAATGDPSRRPSYGLRPGSKVGPNPKGSTFDKQMAIKGDWNVQKANSIHNSLPPNDVRTSSEARRSVSQLVVQTDDQPSPLRKDTNPPYLGQKLGAHEAYESIKPGQIVWAYHNTQINSDYATGDLAAYTRTNKLGNWVFTKRRPFVVIAGFLHKMMALPIYTHGNRGLEKYMGDHRMLSCYVGLRGRFDDELAFEGDNGPAIHSMLSRPKKSCIALKEVVMLDHMENLDADAKERLTDEGTKRLINLFMSKLNRVMKDENERLDGCIERDRQQLARRSFAPPPVNHRNPYDAVSDEADNDIDNDDAYDRGDI